MPSLQLKYNPAGDSEPLDDEDDRYDVVVCACSGELCNSSSNLLASLIASLLSMALALIL